MAVTVVRRTLPSFRPIKGNPLCLTTIYLDGGAGPAASSMMTIRVA
jgi:hypothetical protein